MRPQLGPVTFAGTGLNDATSGGTFTGTTDESFCAQIDGTPGGADPDTFQWGTGMSCASGGTHIPIIAANSPYALQDGVTISFACAGGDPCQGHVFADSWTWTASAPIAVMANGPVVSTGGFIGPSFTGTGTGAALATGTASNTDLAGIITSSGGTATYSFAGTYTNALVCVVQDDTTIASLLSKTVSTTTLTVTTTGASDVVSYICVGRN